MANPVGRPPKLTPEEREEVYEALRQYIIETKDPTMAGFVSSDELAMQYLVTRDNLNDWSEFSTLITKAVQKQEAYLLDGATQNKLNATMAIFRLKQPQHGYSDRQQVDTTVEMVTPILGAASKQVTDDTTSQED